MRYVQRRQSELWFVQQTRFTWEKPIAVPALMTTMHCSQIMTCKWGVQVIVENAKEKHSTIKYSKSLNSNINWTNHRGGCVMCEWGRWQPIRRERLRHSLLNANNLIAVNRQTGWTSPHSMSGIKQPFGGGRKEGQCLLCGKFSVIATIHPLFAN